MLKGPMILEPIIGSTITPDVYAPQFVDFLMCRHTWALGHGIEVSPTFGCVMHEAK